MKPKIILSLFLAGILFIACKPTSNKQQEKIDEKTSEIINDEELIAIVDKRNGERYSEAPKEYFHDTMLVDSLQIIARTAKKFIKWYINDSSPINQDKLFAFSDSLGYYIFDTVYSEYYIKELQNTGAVSDRLIKSLRRNFEQSKVDMENKKLGPETDCCIYYEADIIFNSQDLPSPFQVQEMELQEFIFRKRAKITVEYNVISASLIYENNDWKILKGGY